MWETEVKFTHDIFNQVFLLRILFFSTVRSTTGLGVRKKNPRTVEVVVGIDVTLRLMCLESLYLDNYRLQDFRLLSARETSY